MATWSRWPGTATPGPCIATSGRAITWCTSSAATDTATARWRIYTSAWAGISGPAMQKTQPRLAFTLLVLLGINTMNFFDRQVLGAVAEPLKKDWKLSDKELGALGTAFILLYAVVGVPLGRWADLGRRSRILAGGAAVWSLFTAASGLAWNFWSLFAMRLGVGVGEASCAPAANSLLGDMFPPQRRARALSIFMIGLPLGLGLSFVISGNIAQHWGWRRALWVARAPGLILGILALWIPA